MACGALLQEARAKGAAGSLSALCIFFDWRLKGEKAAKSIGNIIGNKMIGLYTSQSDTLIRSNQDDLFEFGVTDPTRYD